MLKVNNMLINLFKMPKIMFIIKPNYNFTAYSRNQNSGNISIFI